MKRLTTEQNKIRNDAINKAVAADYVLIPCRGLGAEKPKAAAKKNWPDTPYDPNLEPEGLPEIYGVVIPPGKLIIDRDPRYEKDGVNQLKALWKKLRIKPPKTYKVKTGSGGSHTYLNCPLEFKAESKIPEFPALDFKTHVGYVCGAGSLHESGKMYEPISGDISRLADSPEELLDLVRKIEPDSSFAGVEELEDDSVANQAKYDKWLLGRPIAEEGDRNNRAFAYAQYGKLIGLSKETVLDSMINNFCCESPLENYEFQEVIDNAFEYSDTLPQGALHIKNAFADVEIEPVEEIFLSDEPPVPEWPILHNDALYGLTGEIVEAATVDSEADPTAVMLTALVRAGTTFGRKPFFTVGETKHRAQLYSAIVGASSRARKGTSGNPVARIFEVAERKLQAPIAFSESAEQIILPLQVSHGPLSTGEGLVYAVRDPSDKLDKEGLPEDLGVTDKRLFVTEGEFGAPLKSMERDGNTLSAILRAAWDGNTIAPLTKNNRIKATGPHIGLIAHITNAELKRLYKANEIFNGSANRFLWSCARRQKPIPFPKPMPQEVVNKIAAKLAKAIKKAHSAEVEIKFHSESEILWKKIYPQLTRDVAGILGVVTARAEAQCIRLALIYALLDADGEIKPVHLKAALAVWKYCFDSARYIFGNPKTDPDSTKILAALEDGEKSQSELHSLFSGHMSADQLRSILMNLQSTGCISQYKNDKSKGRPAVYWRLSSGFSSDVSKDNAPDDDTDDMKEF